MSESIFEKAKAAAASVTESISSLKDFFWDDERIEIINQFKEKTENKLNEVLETVSKYKALFTEAGYELNGLNASLSIPPDLAISFKFLGPLETEKRKAIISQTSESRLASIILKSLFKASDYAETIKIGEMKLKSINITLGLIPGISISMS
ncbi:MAG: hypothetical protein WAU11_15090 [Ignavibacteriaceae bacterium]